MAMAKDEIEKYIFDPENPKQCKSYDLLLKIAKKNKGLFISKDFLVEIFLSDNFTKKIKDELWDIPSSYEQLSKCEKVDLYIEQLSKNDFIDLLRHNIELIYNSKLNEISQNAINVEINSFNENIFEEIQDGFLSLSSKKIKKEIKKKKLDFFESSIQNIIILFDNLFETKLEYDFIEFNHLDEANKIFFYNFDGFNYLKLDFFKRATILITTLDKWDTSDMYWKVQQSRMSSNNIKPLILKKIEDVEILLNVLEQDLKKENKKNIPQENISTLNKISIKNFFSIKEISLNNLKDKKEIYIVGENGDGKSLLLQSIAVGLKGTQEDGLKEFRAREDKYSIEIENSEDCQNNFLAYGSSRNNSCQLKEDTTGYLTLFSGEYDLKSPTKWLQYLDYSEQKENNNVITVAEAKKLLQELLNSDIQIDISPNKVTFTEKGSEVSFEQLSAGYRGVITIICDILARLSEKQQVEQIKDFQGVVLIDEVELHLHPKWKYNFMKKLRDTFPLIQFIVTTHSPTVLLGASKEAVFYKIYKEDGKVTISNQIANEGYTNNSLVSSPLFDMETITSRDYDKAVSSDDYIYEKIHQQVAQKIKEHVNIDEEELLKLIDEELDKI